MSDNAWDIVKNKAILVETSGNPLLFFSDQDDARAVLHAWESSHPNYLARQSLVQGYTFTDDSRIFSVGVSKDCVGKLRSDEEFVAQRIHSEKVGTALPLKALKQHLDHANHEEPVIPAFPGPLSPADGPNTARALPLPTGDESIPKPNAIAAALDEKFSEADPVNIPEATDPVAESSRRKPRKRYKSPAAPDKEEVLTEKPVLTDLALDILDKALPKTKKETAIPSDKLQDIVRSTAQLLSAKLQVEEQAKNLRARLGESFGTHALGSTLQKINDDIDNRVAEITGNSRRR